MSKVRKQFSFVRVTAWSRILGPPHCRNNKSCQTASHALLSVGVPFPQPGSYIQDFVSRVHRQVPLRDNRVIQDVTPQQCAKLCVQEGSFTCNSFDYCGNFSECRLSDASVANVGQVTLEATASCDVYSRECVLVASDV